MSAATAAQPHTAQPDTMHPHTMHPHTVQPDTAPARTGGSTPAAYRFEIVKLLSQWRVRLVLLACWTAPGVFVAAVSHQSALPSDTVFGRWMHATGWAGALVVLAFCCSWALPLLTSLVAGDAFAAEDRLGTWRHLVTAVGSPRRIFVAKVLASTSVILLMVLGLAVSGVVGGLLSAGSRVLVGLDGQPFAPGSVAVRVLLAWLVVLAPTLAFAGVGLLGSVLLGRSPMGLLVPALLALVLQLVQLLPLPLAVRLALPSEAFLAWRGLFTDPAQPGAALIGIAVALVWASAATAAAYLLFVRRDFSDLSNDGSARRALLGGVLPLAVVLGLTAGVLAIAVPGRGTGITGPQVEQALAVSFGRLYRLQARELHRPDVTEAELAVSATCDRGGERVPDSGPGNDWRCLVSWHIPGARAVGSATYQLDVTAQGRYVADGDGPKEVNGAFTVRTATGDAPNPLWQIEGTLDLLRPTPHH